VIYARGATFLSLNRDLLWFMGFIYSVTGNPGIPYWGIQRSAGWRIYRWKPGMMAFLFGCQLQLVYQKENYCQV
jgi:hypothetical protein